MTGRWAACLALLLACSREAEPAPAAQGVAEPSVAAPSPAPYRGARVTRAAGSSEGQPGQVFETAAGESLRLDFGCGARAEVLGPALVALSARSDQGLLVRRGLVSVQLPPGAAKAGNSCFLASPALRVELPLAARLVLRVHDDGLTRLAVVSGRATRDVPAGRDVDAPASQGVEAGHLLTVDVLGAATDTAGPISVDAALAQLAPSPAEATPGAGPDLARLLGLALDAQIVRLTLEQGVARSLDQQHQRLVADHDPRAMQVQRQIAAQAAQMFRSRRRLEAALAQLEAARLGPAGLGAADPHMARAAALLR